MMRANKSVQIISKKYAKFNVVFITSTVTRSCAKLIPSLATIWTTKN